MRYSHKLFSPYAFYILMHFVLVTSIPSAVSRFGLIYSLEFHSRYSPNLFLHSNVLTLLFHNCLDCKKMCEQTSIIFKTFFSPDASRWWRSSGATIRRRLVGVVLLKIRSCRLWICERASLPTNSDESWQVWCHRSASARTYGNLILFC